VCESVREESVRKEGVRGEGGGRGRVRGRRGTVRLTVWRLAMLVPRSISLPLLITIIRKRKKVIKGF
jgi:hypothetical protein